MFCIILFLFQVCYLEVDLGVIIGSFIHTVPV